MSINQGDMSWRQFEQFVEDVVADAVDGMSWRVVAQRQKPYATPGGDTVNKRLDFHVAERRQGGKGVVIDAKHFKRSNFNRQQVDSTEEYRRLCRASLAVLAVSDVTYIPESVYDYIDRHPRVEVMFVDETFPDNFMALLEDISRAG